MKQQPIPQQELRNELRNLEPAPSPTAQNTIVTLRAQQATALQKGGRYSAEFKAVSAKLTAAYAAAYPGEHRAS